MSRARRQQKRRARLAHDRWIMDGEVREWRRLLTDRGFVRLWTPAGLLWFAGVAS